MDKKLTLNDTINVTKNKKVLISDLVGIKGEIFKYVKKGFWFDDEVLEKAGIKKIIKDVKVECVIVDKEKQQKVKTYPKETESLKNILKSINTLENIVNNYNETEDIISDEDDNIDTDNLTNLDDE